MPQKYTWHQVCGSFYVHLVRANNTCLSPLHLQSGSGTHTRMHTHIYTRTRIYIHTDIRMHKQMLIHTQIHAHAMKTHVYVCTHTYTHVCKYGIYTYTNINTRAHTRTPKNMYTHTHTPASDLHYKHRWCLATDSNFTLLPPPHPRPARQLALSNPHFNPATP